MAELLSDLRRMGIVEVRVSAQPDACAACWRYAGRLLVIDEAPAIPIPGCSRDTCRCDYEPILPR